MQLTILCMCLSPHDLQNSSCALTLFAILQGKAVTFWRYVAILQASFSKFGKLSTSEISFKLVHNWWSYNPQYNSLLFLAHSVDIRN